MAKNGKITETVITEKTVWRTSKYAALYTGIPRRKMGKRCADGKTFPFARKHPKTGAWIIPDNDVTNARIMVENERRAAIELSYETQTRKRPTTASCDRIRIRVENDDTLTDAQRDLFVARIDAYQQYFDARYAQRNADKTTTTDK